MDRICRQLWISDLQTTREESTERFDAVVSVNQIAPDDNVSEDTDHTQVAVADDCGSEYRWGGEFSYERFQTAVSQVVRHLFDDDTTLVHCQRGVNRSSAVCTAAYAIWRDTTYTNALVTVQQAREQADPRPEMQAFARHAIGSNLRGYPR